MGARRPIAGVCVAAIALLGYGAIGAGAAGVEGSQQVQVSPAVHHDTSPPMSSIEPQQNAEGNSAHHARSRQSQGTGSRSNTSGSPTAQTSAPTTRARFPGIGANGSAPPDNDGAAGTTQYVELVNSQFEVFNKTGGVVQAARNTNTIWAGFGGGCQSNNDGDGTILWDSLAQRWFIQQFSVTTTPYLECVAISTGVDATGTWNRYSFQQPNFPDYPKTGVWPDAYYASFNQFDAAGTQYLGAQVCAFDRARMLLGQAATQQCFNAGSTYSTLLPAALDGITPPPAGAPEWFLALGVNITDSTLAAWQFHVDWSNTANSTLTGPAIVNVPQYTMACNGGTCIPQSGTSQQLDSLADRLMYRLAYRNLGDHQAMVVNHAVTAGTSVGERWYELRPSGGALSLFQQGTYAPDNAYRWMGSIAMDKSGDMGLGYSVSSGSLHPGIRYTGRLAGDAQGIMRTETTVITGAGSQRGSNLSRWGDYTEMTVDPSDDCTFWYVNQYQPSNGAFNWATNISSFKFPSCTAAPGDFTISANPSSLSINSGASGTSTISTTQVGSPGTVNLSASVSPAGPTATLNPTSVAAGSNSTLTVGAGSSVATGNYTVTVTGTEGAKIHSTTVAVTVTAPPPADFTISANPTSLSVNQGSSGTSALSTAQVGSAGSVSLTSGVAPAGPTTNLSPTSVAAGGGSTLTVTVGSSVATGNYTVTVTGTEGSTTHSTTVAVTVTAPPPAGVINGGFETGNYSGWTTSGTTSITTASHSGTYAAQVGGTSPTSGDSSVAQTFTAPPAGGSLSFWYKVVCPDSLTYDWATATLKDNIANTTTTPLAKTCSNTGAWQQSAAASLVGGHSYTLTLISHDDNYASDPTYTLYDDVSVGAPPPPPPPPPSGISNGGFETGSFSNWTTSGTTSITTAPHSGTYAAQVGGTSPTNGDSSVAQTFTAGAGATSLSLWYKVVCPDTLTYDWATVTLKDNTTNTTTTVLAKTCSNSGTWQQATAAVTAGHSYALTLISHDDNYASDPTYTLYDDVSLS